MTEDCRKMLDLCDDFLMRRDEAAKEFAAVITALRGPDHAGDSKDPTLVIRRVAFPKVAAAFDKIEALLGIFVAAQRGNPEIAHKKGWMGMRDPKVELHLKPSGSHFESHAVAACLTLGIPFVSL